MPFSILKNPFSEPKKRKTDDAELVGELLGPEEEAEMREAMGDQPIEEDSVGDDTIRLTKEEEAAKRQVEEEVSPKQRWKEYIEWAEEFGRSDEWVGETFTFNDDGGVWRDGSLDLQRTKVARFPKGFKSISGKLVLARCEELISLEYLPSSIGGGLFLNGCTGLKSLEHLPSNIGGSLVLMGCTQIKNMPDGIKIGKQIILDKNQTELKANAEAKGYKVEVR